MERVEEVHKKATELNPEVIQIGWITTITIPHIFCFPLQSSRSSPNSFFYLIISIMDLQPFYSTLHSSKELFSYNQFYKREISK